MNELLIDRKREVQYPEKYDRYIKKDCEFNKYRQKWVTNNIDSCVDMCNFLIAGSEILDLTDGKIYTTDKKNKCVKDFTNNITKYSDLFENLTFSLSTEDETISINDNEIDITENTNTTTYFDVDITNKFSESNYYLVQITFKTFDWDNDSLTFDNGDIIKSKFEDSKQYYLLDSESERIKLEGVYSTISESIGTKKISIDCKVVNIENYVIEDMENITDEEIVEIINDIYTETIDVEG